jgi:uncharacterized protein YidB (DUF937 family)
VGLFDNLTGMLGGLGGQQGGDQEEGAMGIVSSLLRQGGGPSSNVIGSLLGGGGQQAADPDGQGGAMGAPAGGGPGAGGLAGMLETLAANGMADHVASWLSNNPNLPVSEQQIHDALGSDQVRQLASSTGLPVGDFLQQLAQHLPNAASEAAGTNPG